MTSRAANTPREMNKAIAADHQMFKIYKYVLRDSDVTLCSKCDYSFRLWHIQTLAQVCDCENECFATIWTTLYASAILMQ